MLAPDDITIDRLQVRASGHRARAIAGDLERGGWPLVETTDWVFVRQLSLVANPGQVRATAAASLDRALSEAVDGRSGEAARAPAVRFRSLPDLLACLAEDLLAGRAAHKWYWARWDYLWRQNLGDGLAQLLWEYAAYLPAVSRKLAARGRLGSLWRAIPARGAELLREELLRVCALMPPLRPVPGRSDSQRRTLEHHATECFQRHRVQLSPWRDALSHLSSSDPRTRLAAVISGLEFCPLLLSRDLEAVSHAFGQMVVPAVEPRFSSAEDREFAGEDGLTDESQVFADRPRPDSDLPGVNELRAAPPEPEKPLELAKRSEPSASNQRRGAVPTEPEQRPPASSSAPLAGGTGSAGVPAAEPQGTPSVSSWADADFFTDSGGFFYLINALSRPDCLARLKESAPSTLASGWLWLVDIARRLGGELDPPLRAFVARQAGYEEPRDMDADLPLVSLEPIFRQLGRRYRDSGIWGPELLEGAAEIQVSASHVDVHFPLSAVRLPVRLAGLDLNPGWVPWLGRVVTFHYREIPHRDVFHGQSSPGPGGRP